VFDPELAHDLFGTTDSELDASATRAIPPAEDTAASTEEEVEDRLSPSERVIALAADRSRAGRLVNWTAEWEGDLPRVDITDEIALIFRLVESDIPGVPLGLQIRTRLESAWQGSCTLRLRSADDPDADNYFIDELAPPLQPGERHVDRAARPVERPPADRDRSRSPRGVVQAPRGIPVAPLEDDRDLLAPGAVVQRRVLHAPTPQLYGVATGSGSLSVAPDLPRDEWGALFPYARRAQLAEYP
jgi:hypothetical protein